MQEIHPLTEVVRNLTLADEALGRDTAQAQAHALVGIGWALLAMAVPDVTTIQLAGEPGEPGESGESPEEHPGDEGLLGAMAKAAFAGKGQLRR